MPEVVQQLLDESLAKHARADLQRTNPREARKQRTAQLAARAATVEAVHGKFWAYIEDREPHFRRQYTASEATVQFYSPQLLGEPVNADGTLSLWAWPYVHRSQEILHVSGITRDERGRKQGEVTSNARGNMAIQQIGVAVYEADTSTGPLVDHNVPGFVTRFEMPTEPRIDDGKDFAKVERLGQFLDELVVLKLPEPVLV